MALTFIHSHGAVYLPLQLLSKFTLFHHLGIDKHLLVFKISIFIPHQYISLLKNTLCKALKWKLTVLYEVSLKCIKHKSHHDGETAAEISIVEIDFCT